MKRALFAILLIFGISILIPSAADAQTSFEESGCLYNGNVTIKCFEPLFYNLIYWLMVFSGTVAVFFIIFGGIKFLTSGGDPGKIDSAKKTLTFAIIGLVVIISSFMIVNIVADLTGVNCISEFGFDSCREQCGGGTFGICPNNESCVRTSTIPPSYVCR